MHVFLGQHVSLLFCEFAAHPDRHSLVFISQLRCVDRAHSLPIHFSWLVFFPVVREHGILLALISQFSSECRDHSVRNQRIYPLVFIPDHLALFVHFIEELVSDLALLLDLSAILVSDSVCPGAFVAMDLFDEISIDVSDDVDGVEACLHSLLTTASQNHEELLFAIVVFEPHVDDFLDFTPDSHLLSRLEGSELLG